MSSGAVMNMAWKEYKSKRPNPNRTKPAPIHPPTHKIEPNPMDGKAKVPQVKPIVMGGDTV